MELSEFIKKSSTVLASDNDCSVIIFQGVSYPYLFFTQLIDTIKFQNSCDIKSIDMLSGDFAFKSQLSTSFLGMSCVYWLADASSLKAKQKEDFIQFLMNYQGPHKIMVFFDTKTSFTERNNISVVMLKERYFFDDAKSLWPVFDVDQAQKIAFFLNQIYKVKNSYSLDELCLLKNYQDLLGSDSKIFYQSWISRLVTADTSLFILSQLFFEKKEKNFFNAWLEIKPLYSDMFWVSFWSDQVYRSYFFIRFTQEENYAAAKQVSFGLSFSFLKQTYKLYQLHELQNFHKAIYQVDTALKTGGSSYQLDQLYIDFFMGKFKKI